MMRKGLLMMGILLTTTASAEDVIHRWCPPEQVVQTEAFSLSADALFYFAKSNLNGLLTKGKIELKNLTQQLKATYTQVNEIKIVGHTDRIGSEKNNYTLGLRRAKTIKDYLQSLGMTAPIQIESAGESQPITTGCYGNVVTSTLTTCLQPDRRVVITITGVKKNP